MEKIQTEEADVTEFKFFISQNRGGAVAPKMCSLDGDIGDSDFGLVLISLILLGRPLGR